jgi:RHH-type proline utilization regulon transcriptional repressor/proline dehydrogenase/delta 1-pyrroline-5-carboxylate dehydrogenase
MGAVIDRNARQSILEYIELARQEGHLLYCSDIPEGGTYVPFTILEGITPAHRIAQEEVFGPVLSVMKVSSFLAWANATRFALTGAVFSRSPAHLHRARQEFRVGNLYLSRGSTGALVERQPFGGFKVSGGGTKAGGGRTIYCTSWILVRSPKTPGEEALLSYAGTMNGHSVCEHLIFC